MFTLPDLPYNFDSLEPIISRNIMELHHGKHHAGYTRKLNTVVKGTKLESKPIEEILRNIQDVPEAIRQDAINNGGGYYNHSFFWQIMRPPKDGNAPQDTLLDKINDYFGTFDGFKKKFSSSAAALFGSGWAWLVKKKDGTLEVYSTENQDSPLISGDTPILGLDIWEHAYYLDYLNDRGRYIENWWKVVNWEEVERRM